MLAKEVNDLLTQTGPGTPLGEVIRSFWVPVALSRELPERDGAPVRLRVLGEPLVMFRDSDGYVGLVDEACPHRQSGMFFGRNEECGLRCTYHGWKFDRHGNCVDLPSEPSDSTMRSKIKIKSYPTQERGGLIWTYMGATSEAPAFPHFDWLDLPAENVYVSRWIGDSNYLQQLEGEFDTSHVGFLHSSLQTFADSPYHVGGRYFVEDRIPKFRVEPTDFGMIAAAYRIADDKALWRWSHFLHPVYSILSAEPQRPQFMRVWLPIDDVTTSVICISYCYDRPLTEAELEEFRSGESAHRNVLPGTLLPYANKANDYRIDRALQKVGTYSGILGIRNQDAAACESQGLIADRTKERLGTSDVGVIQLRKVLMSAIENIRAGADLPGMRDGELYAIRAGQSHVPLTCPYEDVVELHASMRPRSEQTVSEST